MATEYIHLEGEGFYLPTGSGQVENDYNASNGKTLNIWTNDTCWREIVVPSGKVVTAVSVRSRSSQCADAHGNTSGLITVRVNNDVVFEHWHWQDTYTVFDIPVNLPAGTHRLYVGFSHDHLVQGVCDRNLYFDHMILKQEDVAVIEPTPSGDLYGSATGLFVPPNNPAKVQADKWRAEGRIADADNMDKIGKSSQARWFGDWNADVQADVNNFVTAAAKAGQLPTLVAYNIPIRDCGSYSAGGASSASAYRTWIDAFSAGIGTTNPAVVILEPDALPGLPCGGSMTDAQVQERYDLLSYAVKKLERANVDVYIDAGHSNWHSATEMASRLGKANIAGATGFSLNVSNYRYTTEAVNYGKSISAGVNGKHFIVDTSRNGNGPDPNGEWCNPSGRALGQKPTAATSDPVVDCYMWVKVPGESDGTCNGGPPAGQFWSDYGLGLAQRST